MLYRTLGSGEHALNVSVVAFGTLSVAPGQMHARIEPDAATETMLAALDSGINLFDTAPGYGDGEAERRLGAALRASGRPREAYLVATKAGGPTLTPEEIFADCDASLNRLGLDVIDLYQIHWHKRVVPIAESVDAMTELVRRGKARHIGLCNSGPNDIADATSRGAAIVSDQVVYNLLSRAAEFALVPCCLRSRIGVLCYSPLAQGLLTGRYRSGDELPPDRARSRHFVGTRPSSRHGEPGCEPAVFAAVEAIRGIAHDAGLSMADLATAWLLHQPGVSSVLVGASRPDQVRANACAVDIRLSDEVLRRLDATTATVKSAMGPNLDMWQGAADSRVR